MPAYEALAELYDTLMDDVDYDAWTDYYLALINHAGLRPETLCDCACGTGSLSVRFAQKGISVTGVDLSPEMLSVARHKAMKWGVRTMFVCQDICRLELPHPVDAIVCGCDGVNYILNDNQLQTYFEKVRTYLKPRGVFTFDISSAWKLEHLLGDAFFGEEREDVAYLWSNHFDKNSHVVTMDLSFYKRKHADMYQRFSEVHMQKAHETEHLYDLLTESGFKNIEIFGDRRFEAPEPEELRIHFLAVRN